MIDLRKKEIVVCGYTGFIGRHLCYELDNLEIEYKKLNKGDIDFTDTIYPESVIQKCDYIFNLIGYNGGLEFNKKNKFDIFYQNTLMNLNLLNAARKLKCKKVLSTIASCAYPSEYHIIPEGRDVLLNGLPHESVWGHAWAKRNVFLMSDMISTETNTKCICVCPTTVFGPGDSLDEKKAKVIGSLIIKILKAKQNNNPYVELLGDGETYRHFIYVRDLSKLLVMSMENYEDYKNPLHLASSVEISIKELAEDIKHIINYSGQIIWPDANKNNNRQVRKYIKTDKLKEIFPDFKITEFYSGLEETINWYRARLS